MNYRTATGRCYKEKEVVMMRFVYGLILLILIFFEAAAFSVGVSQEQEGKPWVFYHWLNGNVSSNGISRDMMAMAEQGIGGVLIFNLGQKYPEGPVKYFSSEWFDLLKHTCSEAERHGMFVSVMNCDGWATSGGPDVIPTESMKELTFSRAYVSGEQEVNIGLDEPRGNCGFYRDIAVLAYPTRWKPQNMLKYRNAIISLSLKGHADEKILTDGSIYESTRLGQRSLNAGNDIGIEFNRPTLINRCMIAWDENNMPNAYEVYAENEIGTKELICQGKIQDDMMWSGEVGAVPLIVSFPPVCASRFVIRLKSNKFYNMKVNEVDLLGPSDGNGCAPLINDLFCKSAFIQRMRTVGPVHDVPSEYVIAKDEIYNLTDKISQSGLLQWNVPVGNWTILRIGYTSTGKKNYPATPEGTGLECDKFSKKSISSYFKKSVMPIIDSLKEFKDSSFRFIHTDSWEAHSQNWTEDMPAEFASRMNYDIIPLLPVFSGEIIEGVKESEQFLYDFRSTISNLLKDNYYLYFKELIENQGLEFFTEPCGMQQCYSDFINVAVEMPWTATEIWTPTKDRWINPIIRRGFVELVSAAHLQGRSWISVEGLTSGLGDYLKDPALCKSYVDCAYASGVNHFIIHSYVHQPDERVPGWSMNPWGMVFQRHLTWWNQVHLMTDYMTACQTELQKGVPVVDLLVLYPSDSPGNLHKHPGHQPKNAIGFSGFKYDAVSTDILFNRITLDNDLFCTAAGMKYRALIVPRNLSYTPEQIKKLNDWTESGAKIFARSDDDLKQMRITLLPTNGNPQKASVDAMRQGLQAKALLESCGISADLAVKDEDLEQTGILFNHRKYGNTDSYFLCNQTDFPLSITPTFRVEADSVEIYDPEMKLTLSAPWFTVDGGRTEVPLVLNPQGSVFVRLNRVGGAPSFCVLGVPSVGEGFVPVPSTQLPVVVEQLSSSNRVWMAVQGRCIVQESGKIPETLYSSGVQDMMDISVDWEVDFKFRDGRQKTVKMSELISWTELTDDELKYFSGSAVYRKEFVLSSDQIQGQPRIYLKADLIKNIAQIQINGSDAGSLWKVPYTVDVTSYVHPGTNTVEIKVTNLWVNELIHDAGLPAGKRKLWSNVQQYHSGDRLLDSGIMGSVKLLALKAAESLEEAIHDEVFYQDDFNGGDSCPLNGLAPDISLRGGTWSAKMGWAADGHVIADANSSTAWLPFKPENGKVYRLAVDMSVLNADDPKNWVAMGFVDGTNVNTHMITEDVITVYLRKSGQLSITGSNMVRDSGVAGLNLGASLATVDIVLNTTASPWTFTVEQNGSMVSLWHFTINPSIVGVAISKFSNTEARFNNFTLKNGINAEVIAPAVEY